MYYRLYGLKIRSTDRLPGLIETAPTAQVDLAISFLGKISSLVSGKDKSEERVSADEYWKFLHYKPDITFGINIAATELRIVTAKNRDEAINYLLGPILAALLWMKGIIALHASAIVIGDQVVALLGASGSGKSTTAASFVKAGYPLLTDDLAPLDFQNGKFYVKPGYPRLKLWPTATAMLFDHGKQLPRLSPLHEKRYLDLREMDYPFQHRPLPLGAIYAFRNTACSAKVSDIRPVEGSDRFTTLIPHTNLYRHWLLPQLRLQHFTTVTELARRVPVRWIPSRNKIVSLDDLREIIVEDYDTLVDEKARSVVL